MRVTRAGTALICSQCGREYVYERNKGHRVTLCNSCSTRPRRDEIRSKSLAYKGGKCIKCGYDRCPRALSFHHREPELKSFSIGGNICYSWAKIKAELDKCDLLCANCHMEEEDRIQYSARSKVGPTSD